MIFSEFAELTLFVRAIVDDSLELCRRHDVTSIAGVSYVAIFCQSAEMQVSADALLGEVGAVADATATGNVYVVPEIPTTSGMLRLVKVRAPDVTRPERGDSDFRLEPPTYAALKRRVASEGQLKLVEREEFEMIELMDAEFDVRAYFSNPPVENHSTIPEALKRFGYTD